MICSHDTIVAPATAAGGALCVVRFSGEGCIALCDGIFRGRKPLADAPGHTLHYGNIIDGGETVDDAVAALFRAPHSYTGEDSVEISCHGSRYIVQRILDLAVRHGARMAAPGEFTARAYLAGRMDLSQAEAVADLIAADSRAAHALAANQMRGRYSEQLAYLRDRLLRLSSLLELELDFSEEDVAFADRTELREQMILIKEEIVRLESSFSLGNALKEGVAVAIVGAPNVGKSTLLNRLVGDQRAMVSEIAGTTRDTIEECVNIDGILFRFIDTAGLHDTADRLELMGIERAKAAAARAQILIQVADATRPATLNLSAPVSPLAEGSHSPHEEGSAPHSTHEESPLPVSPLAKGSNPTLAEGPAPDGSSADNAAKTGGDETADDEAETTGNRLPHLRILTVNKIDCAAENFRLPADALGISAKTGEGMDELLRRLRTAVDTSGLFSGETIVSNSRHAEALHCARAALTRALDALDANSPTDLLCEEIRQVLHHLGTITGQITTPEILSTIFSKFCIGK